MTPPRLPPPLPPIPFATVIGPSSTPDELRPTSVRILCILGMVFAAGSVVSPLSTFAMWLQHRAHRTTAATVPTGMSVQFALFNDQLLPWTIVANALALVMGVALLLVAMAAWRLRPAGRRAMLVYAGVALVWASVGGAVNALWVMPTMLEPMSQPPVNMSPVLVYVFGVLIGVITGLVGLVYPICVFVFFRRPNVVAAFARGEAKRL